MQDFRKLSVWQKAHLLTVAVYKETDSFPQREMYGITSQMRRACASIPANIAEGCGRGGQAELGRYLTIAMGSASELEYYLILAHDLELLNAQLYAELDKKTAEVKRMLTALILKLMTDN